MIKRISAILLLVLILSVFSLGAYAAPTGGAINTTQSGLNSGNKSANNVASKNTTDSAISGKNADNEKKSDFNEVLAKAIEEGTAAKDNPEFILNITSPDKDKDSTYVKSYVVSGNSKYSDVIITIAKYNDEKKTYELMCNTDGESSWKIGEFRLFSKEIPLTEGTNKIKILAYRTSEMDEAKIENIQVNCFTIKLLPESIISKVIRKSNEISNEILDLIKGK